MKNFTFKTTTLLMLCYLVLSFQLIAQEVYTVTFNLNGGIGTPPRPITVNAGFGITLPESTTMSGAEHFSYFVGWNPNSQGTGRSIRPGEPFMPQGNTTLYANYTIINDFPNKMLWLDQFAQSNQSYTVDVLEDHTLQNIKNGNTFQNFSYGNRTNITIHLRGIGNNRTISRRDGGHAVIFWVESGVTLTLENITIQARNTGGTVILIDAGGTLIMQQGSVIQGHTGNAAVAVNGSFIMNGGTIRGNTFSAFGVNNTNTGGGGVYVNGTFTMNDGSISGNMSQLNGGAVFVNGVFNMNGGSIMSNIAVGYGGGVFLNSNAVFNKTGGRITGFQGENNNLIVDRNGRAISSSNRGSAIWVSSSLRKETTTGINDNMSYNGNNGQFSGAWLGY